MQISNLKVAYQDKTIFDGFSYTFEGGITAVLGDSGVGKTTLLNCIAGIIPYSGDIIDKGVVSYMFQEPRLIDTASVLDNLLYVRGGKATPSLIEEIQKLLDIVGLKDEIQAPVSTLSGGMQSRIALVRAFLYPSDTLLLDEPFKSLDLGLRVKLWANLIDLLAVAPRKVILVTHDIDEAIELGDNIVVLDGNPAKVVFLAKRGDISLKEKLTDILTR